MPQPPLQSTPRRRPIRRAVVLFVLANVLLAIAIASLWSGWTAIHNEATAAWALLVGGSISIGLCSATLGALCWEQAWRALDGPQRR